MNTMADGKNRHRSNLFGSRRVHGFRARLRRPGMTELSAYGDKPG